MIRRDYFSHNTKGRGETFDERIRRYGYRWRFCGENIYYAYGSRDTPKRTMRAWMKSSRHRSNILDRRYREIGVGTYTGEWRGHDKTTMYTADFGTRR